MQKKTALNRLMLALFRMSRRLPGSDFEIRAFLPDRPEREQVALRVAQSLRLLREFAPSKYDALRRDLPRILVGPARGLGECHYAVGICVLQFDYVIADTTTAEDLALVFIHEGMHGRLHHAGFEWTDAASRARHERLCSIAETVLGARLRPTASLRWAEQRVDWGAEHWTEAALEKGEQHAVEKLGRGGRFAYHVTRLLSGRGWRASSRGAD
ncbi:MAG TPA: hypothetical protein VII66_10450 [Gemmatimonadaceae bacterium]